LSPIVYLPVAQSAELPPSLNVSVRAARGSSATLIKPLTSALANVHSDLALTFRPLADQVDASLIQERVVAMLSGFFGGLALLLAGMGLYGVTSYAVSRRRTELGIRMALGAAPGGVVRIVLQRVALLVAAGLLSGGVLLGTFMMFGESVGAKTVASLLYGVQLRDPLTLAASVLVLAAIGALAGWIPAHRASRIDPALVLRQ
jgi:ABC-type antimicrobial peptide transport system permease subunit